MATPLPLQFLVALQSYRTPHGFGRSECACYQTKQGKVVQLEERLDKINANEEPAPFLCGNRPAKSEERKRALKGLDGTLTAYGTEYTSL